MIAKEFHVSGRPRCSLERSVYTPMLLAAASMLFGCATTPASPAAEAASDTDQKTTMHADYVPAKQAAPAETEAKPHSTASPLRIVRKKGTGKFLNTPAASPPELLAANPGNAEEFDINMVDVPLQQAADALMRDTLGLNYMIAPGSTGLVTVQTSAPLNQTALFDAFRTALEVNGFSIGRENGVYIISKGGASGRRFHIGVGAEAEAGGVQIVPLKFIAAEEMHRILQPIVADSLRIDLDTNRNMLFVSGDRQSIAAALDAVTLFDVDIMKGKTVSRVELASADPTAVAAELSTIFDTFPGGALYGVMEFIPNNVLGSILIISSNLDYANDAENWIRDYENSVRTEIYELRNRSASELAGVLTALLSRDAGAAGAGLQPAAGANSSGQQPSSAATLQPAGAGAVIVADETANAIIVHATAGKQREITKLVKRLDDVADQVLIEATIAEVQLNEGLNFGLRHFFESGNFATSFSGLVSGGATAVYPGLNAVFDDGKLNFALDALASITNVNIISAPSLLVLDNREAILNIGDQVPIVTQTSTSVTDPDAPIVNSVQYRDTGVILRIKPRVDNSGRVILDIHQEVSDVVPTDTSSINSPTIQQRTITTTVAMDDGQSLMLGGLIRQNDSSKRSQVPVLGDIPLLGAPFRRTDNINKRTELLVIITPRVIRNQQQARSITEEYKRKMSAPGALLNLKAPDKGSAAKQIIY